MINDQIPTPAESAYLQYSNVKQFSFNRDFSRRFKPFVSTTTDNEGFFKKSPRLPTSNVSAVHYGWSFLFVKPSIATTTYNLRATITCKIHFYDYDGNQGILSPTP